MLVHYSGGIFLRSADVFFSPFSWMNILIELSSIMPFHPLRWFILPLPEEVVPQTTFLPRMPLYTSVAVGFSISRC